MSSLFIPIQRAKLQWNGALPLVSSMPIFSIPAQERIAFSKKTFIDGNDLINRWKRLPEDTTSRFTIAEVGFGTGLNFLLTWKWWSLYAPKNASLHFVSSEQNPLSLKDLKKCLALWPELTEMAQQLIDAYPVLTPGYHQLSFPKNNITLTLMLSDKLDCYEQLLICGESKLETELRKACIDAWYLNEFPHSSTVWPLPFLKILIMLSQQETTVVGATKQSFADLGCVMGEQTVGLQQSLIFKKIPDLKLKSATTPWQVSGSSKIRKKKAIILGAGLAGCFLANSLARKGWDITLIEEQNSVGLGASANPQTVLFPKLSAYKSPLTEFMLTAFLYANRVYKNLLSQHNLGELKGSLLIAHNEREQKVQQSLSGWLAHYPELALQINKEQASELAGIPLNKAGLFIPLSGWMNTPALCHSLVQEPGIDLVTGCKVHSLVFEDEQWIVNQHRAEVVILTNGPQAHSFAQTNHLPLQKVRGQMTAIKATSVTNNLLIPLCGQGHVLPQTKGVHYLGATYSPGIEDSRIHKADDEKNRQALEHFMDTIIWSDEVTDNWVGIRATTPDYLPLVGPAPIAHEFTKVYAALAKDAKRWMDKKGGYYPGLYLCAGFGSRGLTTIPLCTEWLASTLNNELSCLPRNLLHALAPARFLRQSIIRGVTVTY